ncbi:MAG: putative signal transducing protein [Actinomycetota bacterium]
MKKTVKIFNSRLEAELAKSYLKGNGIESFIFSDDAGQMYPSQQIANGVTLSVEEKDEEIAKKLLVKKDLP